MSRRAVLDRTHLIRMLRDPAFYAACPYFTAFQPLTAALTREAAAAAAKKQCKRCGGDFAIMKPAVDQLFTALQDARQNNPERAEEVRAYLRAAHPGCESFVIYYRATKAERAPRKLQF